jgi:3-hydroxyisobutyrate dehydrogenase
MTTVMKQRSIVGFVGLGEMGSRMARNLLKSQRYLLIVYDIRKEILEEFRQLGAKIAQSPVEIIDEKPDVFITMLPSPREVREVYLNRQRGVVAGKNHKDLLCIDSSTIDPGTAKSVAHRLNQHHVLMIDAPVSGGIGGAERGTLTFMVGGPKLSVDRAIGYLHDMGKLILHCGDHGSGQIAKLCNNLLLSISMIGTAEAMSLGIHWGMDPKLLASVINTSSGKCWSSQLYNPCPGVIDGVPSSNNYEGGFSSRLMTKDIRLALAAARQLRVESISPSSSSVSSSSPPALSSTFGLPLGKMAYRIYRDMLREGYHNKDFSSVYHYLNHVNPKKAS